MSNDKHFEQLVQSLRRTLANSWTVLDVQYKSDRLLSCGRTSAPLWRSLSPVLGRDRNVTGSTGHTAEGFAEFFKKTTSGHRRRIYQHHKSAVEQRQPWLLFDHSQKQRSAYYNEVACQVVLFRSGSNFPASWVHQPTAAFRITRLVNTSLLAGRLPASQRHAIDFAAKTARLGRS